MNPSAAPLAPALPFLQLIVRLRWIGFSLVGILLLLSFNGQWQIGPDSAAYRRLGHQLATTGRYFFRERIPGISDYGNQANTRYPGLPVLLAGIEKVFGPGDVPPLIAMNVMAVLTLILAYRLMLKHVPKWLAVCVVVGMGTNPRFLQYANEILTEIPFLLGMLIAMQGYDRVLKRRGPALVVGFVATFAGLLLAAAMRPSFWMFAIALGGACLWGILRGNDRLGGSLKKPAPEEDPGAKQQPVARWRFGVILGVMTVASLLYLLVLDVRSKHGLLGGGYESRVATRLQNYDKKILARLPDNFAEMFEKAVPIAFLGAKLGLAPIPLGHSRIGLGTLLTFALVGAGIWLVRRNMLFGLIILITCGSLAIMGAVPRYFVPILPLLLAGWGLLVRSVAGKFKNHKIADLVMFFGLGAVLSMNLFNSFGFILTQRGYSNPIGADKRWHGFKRVGFLNAYRGGDWRHVYDVAGFVRKSTSPDTKLVGPEATVLSYLGDRQVYPLDLVIPERGASIPSILAMFSTGNNPIGFDDYDRRMRKLLRAGYVRRGKAVAGPEAGYELAKLDVVVSRGRSGRLTPPRAGSGTRRRRAATQPATLPSTQPATLPASRPATRPARRPRVPMTLPGVGTVWINGDLSITRYDQAP